MMNNLGNIMSIVQQVRNNPMQFLTPMNIPQSMLGNPQAIIQQMMNNGSISQEQYNNAIQMARNLGIKI